MCTSQDEYFIDDSARDKIFYAKESWNSLSDVYRNSIIVWIWEQTDMRKIFKDKISLISSFHKINE